MQLISTHICKGKNIGVHGNLFGGIMLSWLDEGGAAYACQICDTPRMVTVRMGETKFLKPVRPKQQHLHLLYHQSKSSINDLFLIDILKLFPSIKKEVRSLYKEEKQLHH